MGLGDIIATDDDNPGIRTCREDRWQRTHENMKAPIMLEITGNIGDDFVPRTQCHTVAPEAQ